MIKEEFPKLDIEIQNSGNPFLNYLAYRSFLERVYSPSVQKSLYGRTWVILGAGPSLELFDNDDEFKAILKEHPVVSIKQAGLKYPEYSNFHVFNEVRYNPLFSEIGNYRFSVSEYQAGSNINIHFPIKSYKVKDSLFRNNNYLESEIDKTFRRPWGVGIFFELALFLPVLFNAENIILCGIDMNSTGKFHFYDGSEGQDSKAYSVDDFEFFFTKGTVPYIEYWLSKKGIGIYNLSPLSEMPFKKYKSVSSLLAEMAL